MDNNKDLKVGEALLAYKKQDKHYTYADYITWDDDFRCEIIDGNIYMMSAPTRRHQEILGNLHFQFYSFLKGKTCKVYLAPFDVRLNADTKDDIIVQPDIVIICDNGKLNEAGCKGAPDIAVEILSPSTFEHDKHLKFKKYFEAGVREYWIIDPEKETLEVYLLEEEYKITHAYNKTENTPVRTLPGCVIDLADVFEE